MLQKNSFCKDLLYFLKICDTIKLHECHFMGVLILERDIEYRRQIMENYKKDVEPLFRYLSWLESKKGEGTTACILIPKGGVKHAYSGTR